MCSGRRIRHYPSILAMSSESSLDRGGRRGEGGPRVQAQRVAGWINDHGDGSDAVRQVEGESRLDRSPELLRPLATGLDVDHLNIDDSVERAELALRYAQRPDRRAPRDDFRRLIGTLDRREFPIEELAVEFPGLRQVGRGDG